MKLRRIVSLMLALMVMLGMFTCASAQTEVQNSYKLESVYVTMNQKTGALAVQSKETGLYTLTAPDGTALTTEPYIYMDVSDTMFEVAVENGMNTMGLIDSQGNLMVPMQYGDTTYISDRWQIGVVLTEATADNYDYKTFSGDKFYLVEAYDVYYQGAKVGSLERTAYQMAYAYGSYLNVRDKEGNYTFYDSTLTASTYVSSFNSSSEYDETRDGVFHKGSGQQAFVPGCTLTSDDVEQDICLVDGRFVDLQGNVLFSADAKYESIYDFEGDYAKVRMNNKYGLIDRTGREVLACEYDEITYGETYFEGGYQIVIKDGKVGFVNTNGEVTCEFKYAENAVKSTYKMPITYLTDLDGSVIILSGAVGELPQRYAEVYISNNNGCPLFAAETEAGNAGVVDLYGDVVLGMDGAYDDTYDLQISADGSVVVGYDAERNYVVYLLGTGSGAPYEPVTMMSGLEGGTPVADETTAEQPAAEDGSWTCTCGQANNGNFCSACGTARPAEELKCSKCGHVPEAGTTPKFCSECGNAF